MIASVKGNCHCVFLLCFGSQPCWNSASSDWSQSPLCEDSRSSTNNEWAILPEHQRSLWLLKRWPGRESGLLSPEGQIYQACDRNTDTETGLQVSESFYKTLIAIHKRRVLFSMRECRSGNIELLGNGKKIHICIISNDFPLFHQLLSGWLPLAFLVSHRLKLSKNEIIFPQIVSFS